MNIIIPSYDRINSQTTIANLPEHLKQYTTLLLQERDYEKNYMDANFFNGVAINVLPPEIQTVGPTRQWIVDNWQAEKVIILDDDLVFATRRKDDLGKFVPSTHGNTTEMLNAMYGALEEYAMVGVCPREGGNRKTGPTDENTRLTRVVGLRLDVIRKNNFRYDRLPVMEDFDLTLQMLRGGYKNLCLNRWVHNQGGSNTAGGCSSYRTLGVQAVAAHGLAALHPAFVKPVQKQTKTAWGGKERTDVIIQWKQAAKSGQADVLGGREVHGKVEEGGAEAQAVE